MNEHLNQLHKKIQDAQAVVAQLTAEYDQAYVDLVVEGNMLTAPMTAAQIHLATGLAEGTVRNLFCKPKIRGLLADDRHGHRAMRYGDVLVHLAPRIRHGRPIDATKRAAVVSLLTSSGMTQQQIAEAMKVSVRTIERIKAEEDAAKITAAATAAESLAEIAA